MPTEGMLKIPFGGQFCMGGDPLRGKVPFNTASSKIFDNHSSRRRTTAIREQPLQCDILLLLRSVLFSTQSFTRVSLTRQKINNMHVY